jgi:hypothetical protein
MRWHVSIAGRPSGPWEEADVIRMVSAGQIDHVQGEGGGPWLPIVQSPFAAYQAAQSGTGQAKPAAKPSLTGAQWLFILGSGGLLLIAMAAGWLGVLAGLGIVVWSIIRYRKGQPSLMDLAWGTPRGLLKTAMTVGLGLLTGFCGSSSVLAGREAAVKKEMLAKAQESAAKKQADDRKALLAQLPTKIAGWRQRMGDVATTAEKDGPEAARTAAIAIVSEADTYDKMMGPPTVPELAAARSDLQAVAQGYSDWMSLLDEVRTVTEQESAGKASVQKAKWLAADGAYAAALSALDQIQSADAKVSAHLPATFKPALERTTLEQLRKAITPQVNAEKKRLEREEAQRKAKADKEAAYAALCGDKPTISSWDGEVVGLESHLRETANDPDSIDVEQCTNPQLTTDNCWVMTCNVRGKNGFGALILLRKTYYYSKALGFQEAR